MTSDHVVYRKDKACTGLKGTRHGDSTLPLTEGQSAGTALGHGKNVEWRIEVRSGGSMTHANDQSATQQVLVKTGPFDGEWRKWRMIATM